MISLEKLKPLTMLSENMFYKSLVYMNTRALVFLVNVVRFKMDVGDFSSPSLLKWNHIKIPVVEVLKISDPVIEEQLSNYQCVHVNMSSEYIVAVCILVGLGQLFDLQFLCVSYVFVLLYRKG